MKTLISVIFLIVALPIAGKYFSNRQGTDLPVTVSLNSFTGTNFRIFPGSLLQVETYAYTHPVNKNIKVASAITNFYEGGYTSGFYISTNNGLNWTGTNNIKTAAGATITTVGDPIVLVNQNGSFIMTFMAPSPVSGFDLKVGASYSTNNGANWSSTIYIPGVDTADKPISETDNVSGSPYIGRTYMAYDELKDGGNEIKGVYFSYSSDGGMSWDSSKGVTIQNPDFKFRLISDISIGGGGEVFLLWYSSRKYFGIGKSTDGGVSWIQKNDTAISSVSTRIGYEYNDIYLNGVPSMEIDNTGGMRDGWIYTVNVGLDNDSLDIIFHRSTDGGSSWKYSKRVNQDTINLPSIQSMPAMRVDEFGGINIMYLDSRNSLSNDSMEVYLSRSTDGGNSFTDIRISDYKFRLSPPATPLFYFKGYIGSYTGLTSGGGRLTPVWFDNSAGHFQAFSTLIELLPSYEVRVFPEGFYDEKTQKLRMKDTVRVYLRNSSAPFEIIDSAKNILDSITFNASLKFNYNLSPGSYYLDIRHRNSIQTWSSDGIAYSFGSIVNYDFTSGASSAYGSNLKSVQDKWGIYSGDVDQDGFIDLSDILEVFNGANSFLSGYVKEDCSGDSFVDLSDVLIAFNNAQLFIMVKAP